MSYSDILVCLFKHVTQIGAPREVPDFFFFLNNVLPLKHLKLPLKRLYKTNIFTLSECKILMHFRAGGGERSVGRDRMTRSAQK